MTGSIPTKFIEEGEQSLTDYLSKKFNEPNTSDVEIHIKDAQDPTGDDIKVYRLHRVLLSQSEYFKSGWINTTWKTSSGPSQIIAPLFKAGWITEEVLNIVFEMFYNDTFSRLDKIREFVLQIHSLSLQLGFSRAITYCEKLISENINEKNLIKILHYCITHNQYNTNSYKICIQWMKVFFFTMNLASNENLQCIDLFTFTKFIISPDILCCAGGRWHLIEMYEELRKDEFKNEKNKRELALLKQVIKNQNYGDDCPNESNRQRHQTQALFFYNSVSSAFDKKIYKFIHLNRKFEVIVSLKTPKKAHISISVSSLGNTLAQSLAQSTCFSDTFFLDVSVHVIYRTGTRTTKHIVNIACDSEKLDLKDCFDEESLTHPFIISDEMKREYIIGLLVDIKIVNHELSIKQ